MKKIVLIATFIIISFVQLMAQPYQSIFASDTTDWRVYEVLPDAGGTVVYQSYSDTIINEKLYHTFYLGNQYQVSGTIYFVEQPIGFVREDTVNGQWWVLGKDNEDKLVIDLNLQKGDIFAMKMDDDDRTEDVLVDSVYFDHGRKIIEFDLEQYYYSNNMKVKFIEGVGLSTAFFCHYEYYIPSYSLMCKFDNGKYVYSTDANDGDCFYPGGGNVPEKVIADNILVYPNPAYDEVTIKAINGLDISGAFATIYNNQGKTILEQKNISPIIEFSLFEEGLYLIQIAKDDWVVRKKVIVFKNKY